ncbi:Retrovirus-related Pol polyprotein from type-1 retrotransposable element R2 [Araneus ventricosus]|uniref:Retrovirus-related Pol polyprotein from type-1 retrotransposable element R2 n=1 Tax=Araneus ventricosus TaxID=182803 RepID=A0A4Y2NC91_ARAVE|nr:Retrovirus-related Pol polyprotein from type-1 retrotransposable element R2 [Araneus ventricosus]
METEVPVPRVPPDPPPNILISSSSGSSSNSDSNDSEFVSSFIDDPAPDDHLSDDPGEMNSPDIDPSTVLQTVKDIRNEVEAAHTSLLELSCHDSSRLETSTIPDVAFFANETDSKLIGHLDLLFYSDRSSVLSTELKEAWSSFKRRHCRETLFISTCLILDVLLPDKSRLRDKPRGNRSNPRKRVLSRKKRRIAYAKGKNSFNRNPSRYTDSLLNPTSTSDDIDPFNDDFCSFWENVMSLPPRFRFGSSLSERIRPAERWKVPTRFCKARTVFIPKKPGAIDPGDFRPISLTPIPARLFSKILARRLSPAVKMEPEKRGFIESDGISQNIFLFDYVLRHASERIKRTYIASIDIRKAFDSVTHQAVFAALRAQSIDLKFIKVIEFIYSNSSTSFAPYHSFQPTSSSLRFLFLPIQRTKRPKSTMLSHSKSITPLLDLSK